MALTGDSPLWPRTKAQRPVIIAAALTTLVAAALASALAVFAGLALPRAVRHNLATASGTALVISGAVDASQAAQYSSGLPRQLSSILAGTPFAFTTRSGPIRWASCRARFPPRPPARAAAASRSPKQPRSAGSPRTPS